MDQIYITINWFWNNSGICIFLVKRNTNPLKLKEALFVEAGLVKKSKEVDQLK